MPDFAVSLKERNKFCGRQVKQKKLDQQLQEMEEEEKPRKRVERQDGVQNRLSKMMQNVYNYIIYNIVKVRCPPRPTVPQNWILEASRSSSQSTSPSSPTASHMSACPTTLVVKAISFLVRVRPYTEKVCNRSQRAIFTLVGQPTNWFNWAR